MGMKAKVTISADVKVTDEVFKEAQKQYTFKTKEELAEQLLSLAVLKGLKEVNSKIGYYWDGVCNMNGLFDNVEKYTPNSVGSVIHENEIDLDIYCMYVHGKHYFDDLININDILRIAGYELKDKSSVGKHDCYEDYEDYEVVKIKEANSDDE